MDQEYCALEKVMLIVSTKEEVELMEPIYRGLVEKGYDTLVVDTGVLCCDKNGMPPMETLDKLGIPHKSLLDYKTRNIVKILKCELVTKLVVGSDQEYLKRAFVYAADGLGIPQLLLQVGISSNKGNTVRLATKRTLHRVVNYFPNIIRKYLYLLRTIVALRWGVHKMVRMIISDIHDAFTMWDNRGGYGCKYIAIAGDWERGVLAERGIPLDRVITTGHPLVRLTLIAGNGELRAKFGIAKEAKVILLLTSSQVEHGLWSEAQRDEFINGIINAVSPLLCKSVHLMIKIHPVESLSYYQDIAKHRKEDMIIGKDMRLVDAINISDVVVVSGYSTTVLEAGIMGKPVLLMHVFDEPENLPYSKMRLALEVLKMGELRLLVKEMLYNQKSREERLGEVKVFFDLNKEFADGKAVERIVALIESMI